MDRGDVSDFVLSPWTHSLWDSCKPLASGLLSLWCISALQLGELQSLLDDEDVPLE